MGYLSRLQSLHLRNNSLNGEVPMALQKCTELVIIDLSENEFCGSTTSWMGKRLLKLISLDLRSNKFSGQIPSDICHLNSLQILDLANNNLSGEIPRCMGNFTAMATKISNEGVISYSHFSGELLEDAYVVTKGSEFQYDATLPFVTSMDLSSNSLSGEIPKELASLVGLRSLNLSGNCLTGMIPKNVGDMELLESLDFSRNQLSVSKNCTVNGVMPDNRNEEGKGDRPEVDWFYVCMALGFAAGSWQKSKHIYDFAGLEFKEASQLSSFSCKSIDTLKVYFQEEDSPVPTIKPDGPKPKPKSQPRTGGARMCGGPWLNL
ncbi:hypothetical protein RJ639_030393, partial [Escallonia herrerae]